MGRDKIIDLLIISAEALKEIDIDSDTNRDEQFFDFLISILEALK
jgi:hypothetical protein